STSRRNALAFSLGLATVPRLLEGRFTLSQVKDALNVQQSQFRQGVLEGLVIRRESAQWCETRAKLVRPDFTQTIGEHWSRRRIEWNRMGRIAAPMS
ncbi:MAG: RNA ligase family protein, partial [Rhodoferax sp.]|nr:RNA ligase family protein [Rhodoferax sp.]